MRPDRRFALGLQTRVLENSTRVGCAFGQETNSGAGLVHTKEPGYRFRRVVW